MELSSGSRLGHYEVGDRLGKGGMGEVYRARDTKLKRDVALKVLPADFAGDAERRKRFEREAQSVAALNHPNIVTIYSVEEEESVHFLTMELVEGESLDRSIPTGGLDLRKFFEITVPLADALAAAHEKGITHRDLKPANIMVADNGRVKVLDFGLAKLRDEVPGADGATHLPTEGITQEGKILGTVAYMSPEQAEGKAVDSRSDIFSLGIVLYEMATGRRPFSGDTNLSVLSSILREQPSAATDLNTALPRHLGRVIRRCLEKDPRRRYQSALDVRNELDDLRREIDSGEMEAASTPSGSTLAASVRAAASWRRIRLLVAIAALAALAVAGAIWMLNRGSRVTVGSAGPEGRSGPVAVIGFENLGDPADAEQLSRMLVGLITTGLADSGGLELVSSAKVRSSLKQAGGLTAGFDPALAAKAARIAGASTMVVGQVMQSDELLLLTAELVDVASGNTLGSMRAEGAGKSDLFAMAGEIATEVSGQLGPGRLEEGLAIDLAQSLTDSPEAYRVYAAGQVALNETRFEDAIEQLKQAIQHDPTFALAYFELGKAQMWYGDRGGALRNMHNGLQYIDRLPPRWQTTYRAVLDYEAGNVDSAYAALESLVAQLPEMPDPYNYLGEILTHYSKYRNLLRAKDLFARALEIDPTFKVVLRHLTDDLLRYGEVDEARALLDRYRNEHDPSVVRLRVALLYHERHFAEIVALEQDPLIANAVRDTAPFWTSLLRTGDTKRAFELSGREVEQSVGYGKGINLWNDALLGLRVGRFRKALDALSAAPPLFDSPVVHEYGARVHLTHALVLELVGDLDGAIDQTRAAREMDYFHPRSRFESARLLFAAGRGEEGDREIVRLEGLAQDSHSPYHACWLELARAEQQRALGNPAEALNMLRRISSPVCEPIIVEVHELLLARAAEDGGDLTQALRHYQTLASPTWGPRFITFEWDILALYEVARLEQRTGKLDDARRDYRRFLEHWGNADMPVPIVEQAREQLDALGGN